MLTYPDKIIIKNKNKINKTISLPGSKSLTNRALLIAALAEGRTNLQAALIAEDSQVMIEALRELGIKIEIEHDNFRVHGLGGKIPSSKASLDLKLSGTSIRFLTAMLTIANGEYTLSGTKRMHERPIEDLIKSLRMLDVDISSQHDNGCPPVMIKANGLKGGQTIIDGGSSSQYLSALLMISPYAKEKIEISLSGELQSKPFIDMTIKIMADFGVNVQRDIYNKFIIEPQTYKARTYAIETDAMAAGYFWAAAAITGGRIKTNNIGNNSKQGDRRFADVLAEMGCTVNWTDNSCEVIAPQDGILKGGTFDLNDMSDQAQTLAIVALFANSKVRIENIWNLRIKETDRLTALYTELSKFGVTVIEEKDAIEIYPLKDLNVKNIAIDTYDDHRMAMAFALAGLRLENITINKPSCVQKTFPKFFEVLAKL